MLAKKCDRCGKLHEFYERHTKMECNGFQFEKIDLRSFGVTGHGLKDLCKECMDLKDIEKARISRLNNWTMIDNMGGYYCYFVDEKWSYEIFVTTQVFGESDMKAIANAYLTGGWYNFEGKLLFRRGLIVSSKTVEECLRRVVEDYEENM